jgi:hypothetical protein
VVEGVLVLTCVTFVSMIKSRVALPKYPAKIIPEENARTTKRRKNTNGIPEKYRSCNNTTLEAAANPLMIQ